MKYGMISKYIWAATFQFVYEVRALTLGLGSSKSDHQCQMTLAQKTWLSKSVLLWLVEWRSTLADGDHGSGNPLAERYQRALGHE